MSEKYYLYHANDQYQSPKLFAIRTEQQLIYM